VEDIPDNYFAFVDKYLMKEDAKFCSEFYDGFTSNYFAYQLNSNDKYIEIKDLFKQSKSLDATRIYFKLISTEENNLVTQINAAKMLSWELDNYPTEVDSLFRKYNLIFTETSLKKQIQNSIDVKLSSNFKTLAELSKSEDIGEIFQTISQENKNKVLYIDFWGVNCGPCITEFPNSVKLYDELKGKNIEFVYICEPTDSTTWKDAIKKYNLKGINILLTKQQRNQVFAIFKFLGIPRYMIVNKNGEFINENAERPSTNVIKGDLLKLCKQ
jgi:thiol-disulfide isomerase/thioredoxin